MIEEQLKADIADIVQQEFECVKSLRDYENIEKRIIHRVREAALQRALDFTDVFQIKHYYDPASLTQNLLITFPKL